VPHPAGVRKIAFAWWCAGNLGFFKSLLVLNMRAFHFGSACVFFAQCADDSRVIVLQTSRLLGCDSSDDCALAPPNGTSGK
jgi:hypothetical protein